MSNRRANASGSPWSHLLRRALRRLVGSGPWAAAQAYDLWSATYDAEPDNLLVLLDEELFEGLLRRVEVRGRRVIDVGCGTGRHWTKILAHGPLELVGYDVSPGMLARLRRKHPGAAVHLASAEALSHSAAQSCDLLVSTLALSHVPSADPVLCGRAATSSSPTFTPRRPRSRTPRSFTRGDSSPSRSTSIRSRRSRRRSVGAASSSSNVRSG